MSHVAGIQADSTGERRGAAVSFATKEEAMAYIVSLAPHGTNLFDIPRGRKRRSGSFTIDTVHGQPICGSAGGHPAPGLSEDQPTAA